MAASRLRPLTLTAVALATALTLTACTAGASGSDGTAADQAEQPGQPDAVAVADVTTEDVVQVGRLSVAAAQEAAGAALAACQAEGLGFVSVAVVDRAGQVQALVRGDGAAVHTLEAAQAKAYTSAAFGAATSELAPRAVGDGATVADLPGTLFLPGAVPVKIDGATIAGIGVGGAPDGMADEACAAAGLEVLTGPAEG
ncbi:GlcG/HbpS family heme-binding protein [Cellulosimicrobium protaetiae]|uniref:Heme-binding protein n=1 Tax=Cellulosimicrobium protaetiae TaxID=2587808 RepID=A0A6M5UE93_9MICO|nr:heme-binding protein [Cellulosimicrobium protaetiae]QJW35398.1 heme-binding protein [Cellulosimicrobium protaetiae]